MLKNSLVVFPTSRAIRGYINIQKKQNGFLEKLIPIGEFFSKAIYHKDKLQFVDKNLKKLFLKEAILDIDITQLGFDTDFNSFLKQSDYIFRFYQEVFSEYSSFDKLLQYDTYLAYSDHIEILRLICERYKNILESHGYTDSFLMPLNYELNKDYLEQFSDISINLEGYLSKYEFKIVKDISKIIPLNINLTINEYNKKNSKLFELKEELQEGYNYQIDLTHNRIAAKYKDIVKKQDITISPIVSKIEQIAFIKYHITNMINSGIEPQNIALITPDESIVNIVELFDEEHYFNYAMGKTIYHKKLYKTLKLITKLIVDKEPKDEEKIKFYNLDTSFIDVFFKSNWEKVVTKDIFLKTFEYLFSLEEDSDIKESLENIKISLEILLFNKQIDTFVKIRVKEFIKILQTEISKIKIDDTKGGKITVLGILETRNIEFDGIIVCDFNDDKIPKISVKDKFISTALKELANLPTLKDRENLQRYYYKRVFDKAKSIAISYVDDEANVMSRFITSLFKNYKQYIEKKDFSAILYQKRDFKHFDQEIEEEINLSTRKWSATSLKTYLTCKRKYYLKYIKNIKEHTISLLPQSYDIGNIIHTCLETAVKENKLNNIFINSYLSSFAKENPFLILELQLWKKRLEKFIELEEIRRKNNIAIHQVELPFNLEIEGININGKIDRIDRYPDLSYEIIDYKTSSSLKIDTIKTYEDSTDFQLEFYYLALEDKNEIKNVSYYELSSCSIKSEVVLKEKVELLKLHLKALHTTKVNFKKCDDLSSCQYCSYKTICDRE